MSNKDLFVPKLTDRQLARAFVETHSTFREQGAKLSFSNIFNMGLGSDPNLSYESDGCLINQATLALGDVSWTYNRMGPEHSNGIYVEHDKLQLAYNSRPDASQLPLITKIDGKLQSEMRRSLALGPIDSKLTTLMTRHKARFGALEEAVAQVTIRAPKHLEELDRKYAERSDSLQQSFDAQRREALEHLANQQQKIAEDSAIKAAALDTREAELHEREKQLDDRNNTHVRREIRDSLKNLVQTRLTDFKQSSTTQSMFRLIAGSLITAIVGTGALTIAYFGELFAVLLDPATPTTVVAILAAKSTATTAVTVSFIIWLLRWLNGWFTKVADAEFKLHQFRLDVERASWLAETVLEWKSVSTEPFPELLASRLSTGLFESKSRQDDESATPAEQLAKAILSAGSSAELNFAGQKINLNRAAIQKLDKSTQT